MVLWHGYQFDSDTTYDQLEEIEKAVLEEED
jgi:hypothetical protein